MADTDDVIVLNVGGTLYTTIRSTLTRYPDSMLASVFSEGFTPLRDANGALVIDGDGPMFRHVLNFLRCSKLNLPEDFKDWDLLASEADFYKIPVLKDAVLKAQASKVGPKMEFIEFIEGADGPNSFKYRGSLEIFKKIPQCLLKDNFDVIREGDRIIQRHACEIDDFLENRGEVNGYFGRFEGLEYSETVKHSNLSHIPLPKLCKRDPPHWMKIFQHATGLGFELLSTSVSNATKSWLFARKL